MQRDGQRFRWANMHSRIGPAAAVAAVHVAAVAALTPAAKSKLCN